MLTKKERQALLREMRTRVDELEVPYRIIAALVSDNVLYLGDLLNLTRKQLSSIQGIGPKSISIIEECLRNRGWGQPGKRVTPSLRASYEGELLCSVMERAFELIKKPEGNLPSYKAQGILRAIVEHYYQRRERGFSAEDIKLYKEIGVPRSLYYRRKE